MNDLFHDILNRLDTGIILVDHEQKIVLWNQWMVDKTKIISSSLMGHPLSEACPRFELQTYRGIIETALETTQSRFLSGAVHGAFFKQTCSDCSESVVRQNLQVEPIAFEGNQYVLIQVHDVTTHYQKVKQMKNFIKNLESENDDIRQTEELSRQLSRTDPLTGLSNRLHFMNQLEKTISPVALNEEISAVVYLDLDDFKQVNDTHGHAIGDLVLQETAKRLTEAVRNTDLVCRVGGDEFTLILNGIQFPKDVIHIADKIMMAFTTPYKLDGLSLKMCCSFGISIILQDGTNPSELVEKADIALYRVKKAGKCGYALYSERDRVYKCR